MIGCDDLPGEIRVFSVGTLRVNWINQALHTQIKSPPSVLIIDIDSNNLIVKTHKFSAPCAAKRKLDQSSVDVSDYKPKNSSLREKSKINN